MSYFVKVPNVDGGYCWVNPRAVACAYPAQGTVENAGFRTTLQLIGGNSLVHSVAPLDDVVLALEGALAEQTVRCEVVVDHGELHVQNMSAIDS
jgi:hypothetical protein